MPATRARRALESTGGASARGDMAAAGAAAAGSGGSGVGEVVTRSGLMPCVQRLGGQPFNGITKNNAPQTELRGAFWTVIGQQELGPGVWTRGCFENFHLGVEDRFELLGKDHVHRLLEGSIVEEVVPELGATQNSTVR